MQSAQLACDAGSAWDCSRAAHPNDPNRPTDPTDPTGTAAEQLILLISGLIYFFHLLGCVYYVIVRAEFRAISETYLSDSILDNDWLPPQASGEL